MPLLEWNEDLSIGIDSIDGEHKIFFNHLNELYEAIQFGKSGDVLRPLLDKLVTYSVIHFEHEEEYMMASHYPEFELHKNEHEKLRNKLMQLQSKSEDHVSIGLSNETFAFLKGWLTHHLLDVDRRMADYLLSQGIIKKS